MEKIKGLTLIRVTSSSPKLDCILLQLLYNNNRIKRLGFPEPI